jgi:hypothetical protein
LTPIPSNNFNWPGSSAGPDPLGSIGGGVPPLLGSNSNFNPGGLSGYDGGNKYVTDFGGSQNNSNNNQYLVKNYAHSNNNYALGAAAS